MLTPKRRGQISVEALIIVGVLVIGGVIFGAVYFNQLNEQAKKGSELSGLTDTFLDDFGNNDTPPTPSCNNNGVCEPPLENENNCSDCTPPPDGCDEDGFCEPGEDPETCSDCQNPVFSDFNLTLDKPLGPSPVNAKFSLKAQIKSGYPSVEIYDITLMKFNPISYSWSNSKKCKIGGVEPGAEGIYNIVFLMKIEDVLSQIHGKIIDGISCSEEGEYRFSAMARPKSHITITASSNQLTKIITPVGPGTSFSVLISSPVDGKYYFTTDKIDFIAKTSPELSPGETDSCVWYVNGEIKIPLTGQTNSCSLSQVSLSDTSIFSEGLNKITVYAQRSTTTGKLREADASVEIYILKPINPGVLYLSTPRNVLVGEDFIVKVYGTDEKQVTASRSIDNFTFTGNKCAVISNPTCASTRVNGTIIYYCDYPAVCSYPAYSQTGAHLPVEITANLSGTSESAKFYSEYDLLSYSGNCNTTGTEYGILNLCIYSTGGSKFNSNYWLDNGYGLLKLYVDSPKSEVSNSYGTFVAYVSE